MRPDHVPARAPLPPLGDIAALVAWLLPPPHGDADAALFVTMWIGIAVRARDEQMRRALEEEARNLSAYSAPLVAADALRAFAARLAPPLVAADVLGAQPGDPVAVAPAGWSATCCPYHASGGHPDDRHGGEPVAVVAPLFDGRDMSLGAAPETTPALRARVAHPPCHAIPQVPGPGALVLCPGCGRYPCRCEEPPAGEAPLAAWLGETMAVTTGSRS